MEGLGGIRFGGMGWVGWDRLDGIGSGEIGWVGLDPMGWVGWGETGGEGLRQRVEWNEQLRRIEMGWIGMELLLLGGR